MILRTGIVKGRYGETYDMLAVTAIAANIRFAATAGVQAGFGPSSSYDGNLVPFSGGVAYEENPTITYAPASSAEYVRQLLTPIPLDILIMAGASMTCQIIILLVTQYLSLTHHYLV